MAKVNLFDAFEICLQALEKGEDLETCLAGFPELADELRPGLTAAVQARSNAISEVVPIEVVRRSKARVLQAAAELREQASAAPVIKIARPRQKAYFGARFFRLAATTAIMLIFLLTGGTGLVYASSTALPGDHLYPVKRSWEDVRLFFVFDQTTRVELEHEFEQARVQEIETLYSENRVAQVNFQGEVQGRNNGDWVIGGLNIAVDDKTNLASEILPGVTVRVEGETDNGVIKAERIYLVATPVGSTSVAPGSTLEPTEIRHGDSTESDDHSESVQTPGAVNPTPFPVLNPTGTKRPPAEKPGSEGGSSQEPGSGGDSSEQPEGEGSGGG